MHHDYSQTTTAEEQEARMIEFYDTLSDLEQDIILTACTAMVKHIKSINPRVHIGPASLIPLFMFYLGSTLDTTQEA